jgi:hypothetical protein
VPLAVTFLATGAALGTIGSAPGQRSGRAWMGPTLFRFELAGDLLTADGSGGRQLPFYLKVRDGEMYGAATMSPPAAPGQSGRASYWVELTKQK